MLKRRTDTARTPGRSARPVPDAGLSRRDFLRASGLGGLALAGIAAPGTVRRAPAATRGEDEIVRHKTVCPFCSVGCSIWAEVRNGVWIGQEPVFESPINQGTHCCKGASTREMAIGERRLKYPMKKVAGEWQRIGWDQAMSEIGAELRRIRDEYGPDSAYWLGSAKF
ncbi:MAG TPA: molybdopterin-dependent oxidoreductase, partial [Thermohalobaculum sp.]|nr:molybdopterin-dependent oxidoreductase [Thermohalobaculum sp.]